MSFFFNNHSAQPACTSNVHRPMGGIAGLREVHDDVGRLTVSVFPFAMVKDISLTLAAVPACYILADHATAYIGETGNAGRRCQSAFDWDPLSASKRDPFDRRALLVALGSSELVGVAETARARVV
ncbi:hypothetical protein ABIF68_002161 [Bradyrhizobium japonicum]